MSAKRSEVGFKSFLAGQLKKVDRSFAKAHVDISDRPLRAAVFVVDHLLVRIKDRTDTFETKEDYLRKPWFRGIYQHVHDWYEEHYGEALVRTKRDVVLGFVPLLGMPFKLTIPLSVRGEDDKEKEAVWVCLPNSVLPQEKTTDWLATAPNLKYLTGAQRRALTQTIANVGEALRSIRVNLMTANYPDNPSRKLGETIIPHFERGAIDLVIDPKGRGSLSIWEFHLAAEKAIKLYLRQRGIQPPKIHDLRKLHGICLSNKDGVVQAKALSKIPATSVVIQHRYGEIEPPDLQVAFQTYLATLQLAREFTKKLTRKFTMNNASFLFKQPPWVPDAGT